MICRAKFARFGDNMKEVAVTEGDKVEAQLRLGYAVNGYGLGELAADIEEVAKRLLLYLQNMRPVMLYKRN